MGKTDDYWAWNVTFRKRKAHISSFGISVRYGSWGETGGLIRWLGCYTFVLGKRQRLSESGEEKRITNDVESLYRAREGGKKVRRGIRVLYYIAWKENLLVCVCVRIRFKAKRRTLLGYWNTQSGGAKLAIFNDSLAVRNADHHLKTFLFCWFYNII